MCIRDSYRAALQFLCYVSLDDLPQDDQLVLARDISLAALLGDSVYSFAELLLHPVVCFYSPLVVSCACELLPSDYQQTHLHQDASLQISGKSSFASPPNVWLPQAGEARQQSRRI